MKNKNDRPVEIWAVGGGKGGTGKTFAICQLATCLASGGKQVILIDTDFGAANVHTFFGMKKSEKTIINFFEGKEDLEKLIIKTKTKNLSLIPGSTDTSPFSTLKHTQKLKLLRQLKKLAVDYILLDLGGGTSLDTLDLFLMADKMIVVTIPEITAVENLYQFIKSVFFRKLKSLFGHYGLKDTAKNIWQDRKEYGITGIIDLLEYLRRMSDEMDAVLSKELSGFHLNIILNKVRNIQEVREGFSLRSICIKYIGVNAQYSGYIGYDYQFWKNLNLLQSSPLLIVSHNTRNDVQKIVDNILQDNQLKIDCIKNI